MRRRHVLHSGAAVVLGAAAGCQHGPNTAHIQGDFTGVDLARGHALRDALAQGLRRVVEGEQP